MERLVTTGEAAQLLGLSLQGVHYRIKSGQLKSLKQGGKTFVYVTEFFQQEAKNESFKAFITKIAEIKNSGKQVIIGTSEEYNYLQSTVRYLEVNLKHFDSDIIKKLDEE